MQDVIFSGTENRKPLSYAYVAITLDNSDHQLPIDYEEVTVTRKLYRSGESEYLINGSTCRLKDVNELFYDSKTILQEIVQSNFKEPVSYELLGEKGPDHNKVFEVAVQIGDDRYGVGSGRTKKAAEQEAAYQSILALRKKNIE